MGTDGVTCELRVGRLLEVRAFGRPAAAELAVLAAAAAQVETRVVGQWVTVVDVRKMILTSDTGARGFIDLMIRYNSRTERAAYLLGRQSLFSVQLEAMVLQARNPERRVFRTREELEGWIGAVCTPEERQRLVAFLDG